MPSRVDLDEKIHMVATRTDRVDFRKPVGLVPRPGRASSFSGEFDANPPKCMLHSNELRPGGLMESLRPDLESQPSGRLA